MSGVHKKVTDLNEAIELLCSSYQIAARQGRETNWPAFAASLEKCLAKFNRNGVTPRTYRMPIAGDHYDPSKN